MSHVVCADDWMYLTAAFPFDAVAAMIASGLRVVTISGFDPSSPRGKTHKDQNAT